MKRLTLTIFSAIFAITVAFSQPKLPPQVRVWMPQALTEPLLSERKANELMNSSDYGLSEHLRGEKKAWIVYSDRSNNTTYMEPKAKSEKFSELHFNEKLYIAEIKNGYALVYNEPKQGTVYPLISEVAVCRGWVPMKNLLLWRSCLTNDYSIYQKALLCVNLEQNFDDANSVGIGYKNPTNMNQGESLPSDMEFYYIMKREGDMYLLASQSKMDGAFSDQVLRWWTTQESFVPWNQRSCLEPTWKHEDVQYFVAKNINVPVFKNNRFDYTNESDVATTIPFVKKTSKRYDQYLYRMDGANLRYPILDDCDKEKTYYSMSTFGAIGGTAAGTGLDMGMSKPDSIHRAKLLKARNINLAIVIDGTKSMEPFYPAVKEAIKEGCLYFKDNQRIKVGVVIYRDYTDGEEGLVEVLPLTDVRNITRINNFLDTGGKYGIRSAKNDYTETEALFYGINTALDTLRFQKGESNMMLVVGDCGNIANDTQAPTEQELAYKMAENEIHLLGFQVQNKMVSAYNAFSGQILHMISNSMKQIYDKYNENSDQVIRVSPTITKNEAQQITYNYTANTDAQLHLGSHRVSAPNVNDGKMSPKDLTVMMTKGISDFQQTIQLQIDLLVNESYHRVTTGFDNSDVSSDGVVRVKSQFLRERLGEEYYEALKDKDALVNFRGYAKRKDASGRDFFQPVIFISLEEFDDLLKRLAPVNEAADRSEVRDRTPYIEAMKALVRSLNPGITDADMATLNNNDITRMIGGLNEAPASLSYTLDDLASPIITPDDDYLMIINTFQRKYRNLQEIRQRKSYKFVKEFNGVRYYWLPIEALP